MGGLSDSEGIWGKRPFSSVFSISQVLLALSGKGRKRPRKADFQEGRPDTPKHPFFTPPFAAAQISKHFTGLPRYYPGIVPASSWDFFGNSVHVFQIFPQSKVGEGQKGTPGRGRDRKCHDRASLSPPLVLSLGPHYLPNQFPSFLYSRGHEWEGRGGPLTKWGWRGRGPTSHDILWRFSSRPLFGVPFWPSQKKATHKTNLIPTHSRDNPEKLFIGSKTKGPGEKGAPRNHPEISSQKLADFECRFPYDSYGRDGAPFWPFLGG